MATQRSAVGETSSALPINTGGLGCSGPRGRHPAATPGSPSLSPGMMRGTTVGFYSVAIPNASATRVDVPSVFSPEDHNSPYCWDGDGPSSQPHQC